MTLDVSSIIVSVLFSAVTTTIVAYIVTKRFVAPLILAVVDEKTKETQQMMKAAASSLGVKSGEVRQIKKMEKMMLNDILEQYPELEMALEYFSPDTAELIKQHPQRAMTLIARYKPILDDILGREGSEKLPFQY